MAPELRTPRLLLRAWHERDRTPFAVLNADPEVMAEFPRTLTRAESDAMVDRIIAAWARQETYGLWAVEVIGEPDMIGFIGLGAPNFTADFTPCIEIGWRLARASWGRGYAREGANAVLDHAFKTVGLDEVVSFTSLTNARSEAVMRAIGLTERGTFDHPNIEKGHRLERHVLYAITRAEHAQRRANERRASERPASGPR